jgi:hyaluronoglucosaminidase
VGVDDLHLLFDDIEPELRHEGDRERFASLAAAQAHVANRLLAELGGEDRSFAVCPTEYAGVQRSPYRDELREVLDPRVLVYWTGNGVVVPEITRAQAEEAAAAFGHELLLWDNYPVNDFDPTKLFLGPLRGRAPDLPAAPLAGILANPMVQYVPSKLPLATVADYVADPAAYDPDRSFEAALRELGREVVDAL